MGETGEAALNIDLVNKVRRIYTSLKRDFYLCRDDLTVNKEKFNSSLLFGLLTEVNRGKMILYGEYGGGKTTSAEYLHSVCHSLPLGLIKRVSLRGDPQKTDEKIIGRPHYGKLYGEEEEVVWQHFVLVGPKIVDEFNRIPESNQSIVLNGVDRGEWTYLNDYVYTGPQALFATCNYADRGNNTLIPPLLDRFDVATESKFPGVSNAQAIANNYRNTHEKVLYNRELTNEAIKILRSGEEYHTVKEKMDGISEKFREQLETHKIPCLGPKDFENIETGIENVTLNNSAGIYLNFLIAELNVDPKTEQKRSIDTVSRDNGTFLNALYEGAGSRRGEKSIVRYTKALTWLMGKKEAGLDEVVAVAPYVLWHRMNWTDETVGELKNAYRKDPLKLYITKKMLGDGTTSLGGVLKRVREHSANYLTVLKLIKAGHPKQAEMKAIEFYQDGKGHPIFYDLMEELI